MHSNPLKGYCNIWQPVDNRCFDWLLAFFQVLKCMQVQVAWGPWHVAPSCRFSWWLLSLWFLHLCHARHLAASPTQQQPLLQRASCHCLWCSQLWQRRPRVEGFRRLGKLSRVSCNGIMQDYMMPPSWPFLLVFGVLAFALLVAGNFIFPGKKWKDGDEDSESLEVKLIFWSLISESAADSWFEPSISSGTKIWLNAVSQMVEKDRKDVATVSQWQL